MLVPSFQFSAKLLSFYLLMWSVFITVLKICRLFNVYDPLSVIVTLLIFLGHKIYFFNNTLFLALTSIELFMWFNHALNSSKLISVIWYLYNFGLHSITWTCLQVLKMGPSSFNRKVVKWPKSNLQFFPCSEQNGVFFELVGNRR